MKRFLPVLLVRGSAALIFALAAFFVFVGIASAQEIESPYEIGYYCPPYAESYEEGGYYESTDTYCTYDGSAVPRPFGVRYAGLYKGVPGDAVRLNRHSLGRADVSNQVNSIVGGEQGADYFVAIWWVRPGANDVFDFDDYFGLGSGTPPHNEYGILRWKWGEEPLAYEECCSSVLFLPGVKGSVLKKHVAAGGAYDTLWPPSPAAITFSEDLRQLAMTPEGESINDVFVDGVLDTFYQRPIYSGFASFMDKTVTDGVIAQWKPFPYDWRYSPARVVTDGVQTENEVVSLVETIEEMAAESDTGQVTIIAHSMGGLVGKVLIKHLEETGRGDLIDSFVMVGTPQLGTPQAAGALLHGDSEDIAGGFIVDAATSREIGQNMQSGYDLLPSPRYFEVVTDEVITFDQTAGVSVINDWIDYWGDSITVHAAFKEFITGEGVSRVDPNKNDLAAPEILSTNLVDRAVNFHEEYDSYVFPEDIRVVQVAGWGIPTMKAVEYTNWHFLFDLPVQSYRVVPTREGDKTVVYPSALFSNAQESYFFNLEDFRVDKGITVRHRDLVSSGQIQTLIRSVIEEEDFQETPYITVAKPGREAAQHQIIVSSHSPVVLGAYDENGNFTGIDPDQDLSAAVLMITEDIPGSTFIAAGGSQYIFLPKEGSYEFVYKGVGTGPTTVTIEDFSNDVVTPIVQYADIPTTPSTSAEFQVDTSQPEKTHISVDADGDGVAGLLVLTDEPVLTLEELVILLRTTIKGLHIKDSAKFQLLALTVRFEPGIDAEERQWGKYLTSDFKARVRTWNKMKVVDKFQYRIEWAEQKGLLDTENAQTMQNLLSHIRDKL